MLVKHTSRPFQRDVFVSQAEDVASRRRKKLNHPWQPPKKLEGRMRKQDIRWEIGSDAELDSFSVRGAFITELGV